MAISNYILILLYDYIDIYRDIFTRYLIHLTYIKHSYGFLSCLLDIYFYFLILASHLQLLVTQYELLSYHHYSLICYLVFTFYQT